MTRITLAATATAVGMLLSQAASAQETLVVWWNKGFYEAEDVAIQAAVAKWEAANPGTRIELTLIPVTDMLTKAVGAIQAGNVPDIAFGWIFDFQASAQWAKDGVLADLGEVVATVEDDLLSYVKGTVSMTGPDGQQRVYAAPIYQQNMHFHYWKDMLEEAGFSEDDVPTEWRAFWDFWCDDVQGALRAKGQRVYGVGLPSSTAASDTFYTYYTFIGAYGVRMVDETGALLVDDPAVREGMKLALEDYADIYTRGCSPPGSVSWNDGGNNTDFHNRTTVTTPNASISIPGKHLDDGAMDNYLDKIRTVLFPDGPGGEMVYTVSVKQAVVFEAAQNKDAAKSFLAFLLQPENMAAYVEGGLGRWFPVQQALVDRSFWTDPADPHRSVVHAQYTQRPSQTYPSVLNPGFTVLQNENAFATAIGRMIVDGWDSDRAIDELIGRIKQVAG
jgi:multiple sugar transport system substrate-binding protein